MDFFSVMSAKVVGRFSVPQVLGPRYRYREPIVNVGTGTDVGSWYLPMSVLGSDVSSLYHIWFSVPVGLQTMCFSDGLILGLLVPYL